MTEQDPVREALAKALDPARHDPVFRERLDRSIEENREVLDRLAEDDHGFDRGGYSPEPHRFATYPPGMVLHPADAEALARVLDEQEGGEQ